MISTYKQALSLSAALNNDQDRAVYTDVAQLPYLNIALMELEEIFELNDIPITGDKSGVILVPDGMTEIGFSTNPALPQNLIEVQELWESEPNLGRWLPVGRRDSLSPFTDSTTFFRVWKWNGDAIELPAASADIDLKIKYLGSIFSTITIGTLNKEIEVKNAASFIQYRTAALCAQFIGEDKTRADDLNSGAGGALERSMGISVKSKQGMFYRRRPFRASYKARRSIM